ncbi:hypothetical protein [Lacrimispora sp.]|uniref:hypothetical protein n=1 Tax=Lacrimispora sp. TaxID=2719234 RepID=UPI0028AC5F94|nr:hypothetical protein [Lacrimispora sp.]
MNVTPELITLSTELASIIGRKSVETIFDRINSAKKKGNKDEIIGNLEEIINDLISDKNRLIQISQAYEEILITQKISEDEIDYITTSIIPLLEDLFGQSNSENMEKIQYVIDSIKSLISKESFNIMQMLGFNFKKAIGEPLTDLISSLIKAKITNNSDKSLNMQLLSIQRELEYLKVCQDEEAYERLMKFNQK